MQEIERSHWGNRAGFIFAAAGSAVGLGNIWRFPYMTGENGGSIFVLVYLLAVAFLGLPILIAEVLLGKATQRNPVGAFKSIAGDKSPLQIVGFIGLLAAFVILSYYSVIAGWALGFMHRSIAGVFEPGHSMEEVKRIFNDLTSSPVQQIVFHGIFISAVIAIVAAGVQKGIQRWNELLMPALIFILIGLIIYGFSLPGAMQGIKFMLQPNPGKLTGASVLAAIGQCFFSLSLGMGAMITYGSYLKRHDRASGSSGWVVTMDTGIALLAGFAVFPIVFSFGQEPAQGPGLVFVSLPAAFLQMPGGTWVAMAFFILLFMAALTSAISLLEVITAYFSDEHSVPRHLGAVMFGFISFLTGIGVTYSSGYFDFLDKLASNYLLPLGAVSISLFVGWRLKKEIIKTDFEGTFYAGIFGVWLWCIRLISPVLVIIVFLNALGLF